MSVLLPSESWCVSDSIWGEALCLFVWLTLTAGQCDAGAGKALTRAALALLRRSGSIAWTDDAVVSDTWSVREESTE